jgi:hypothetical protein
VSPHIDEEEKRTRTRTTNDTHALETGGEHRCIYMHNHIKYIINSCNSNEFISITSNSSARRLQRHTSASVATSTRDRDRYRPIGWTGPGRDRRRHHC